MNPESNPSTAQKPEPCKNELCVMCDKETEYPPNYPVDLRKHYVEGAGQLCAHCFDKVYDKINK